MTAALAAASARYGVSVAERLETDGRGGSPACVRSGFSGWRDRALYPLSIFIHAPLSDWRPCFKVRVTSQNGPQLLVSKKWNLAVAKGSELTSIE